MNSEIADAHLDSDLRRNDVGEGWSKFDDLRRNDVLLGDSLSTTAI